MSSEFRLPESLLLRLSFLQFPPPPNSNLAPTNQKIIIKELQMIVTGGKSSTCSNMKLYGLSSLQLHLMISSNFCILFLENLGFFLSLPIFSYLFPFSLTDSHNSCGFHLLI